MHPYKVSKERRYWVVRAESGHFYQNFTQGAFIALGHLNDLDIRIQDTAKYLPKAEDLKNDILKRSKEQGLKPRQASINATQVNHFIHEMKCGDWVITVGHQKIRIGLITSLPFISNTPHIFYHDPEQKNYTKLEYKLRRSVSWGPLIKNNEIPYGLQKSLKANQTIFNIDKHVEAIHHTLYPIFVYNEQLHLSFRIRSQEEIRNHKIVNFLAFLDEIEFIAKEIDNNLTKSSFLERLEQYSNSNLLTLTTKAQYHSPGEIWAKLQKYKPKTLASITLAYAMLFGNSNLGMDGLIDLETRQRLYEIIIDRMKERQIQETTNALALTYPQYKTEQLESLDSFHFQIETKQSELLSTSQ